MIENLQPFFACEYCGRSIGREIMRCSERAGGRCPFIKQNLADFVGRMIFLGMFLVSIFSSWFVFTTDLLSDTDYLSRLFLLVVCFVVMGVSLYATLLTRTQLYNPISGLRWKRTALLGITLEQRLILGGKTLPVDFMDLQPLAVPPSVAALTEIGFYSERTSSYHSGILHRENEPAARIVSVLERKSMDHSKYICRAALIGLLARGLVEILQSQRYVARGRGRYKRDQDMYTLMSRADLEHTSTVKGKLERKIMEVLDSWKARKGEEKADWPDGPPILWVIMGVYERDVYSPEKWVIDLVAWDAVASGWGEFKGRFRKKYQLSQLDHERLRSTRDYVNELNSSIAQQLPEFSEVLDDQIQKAIKSRQVEDHLRWT